MAPRRRKGIEVPKPAESPAPEVIEPVAATEQKPVAIPVGAKVVITDNIKRGSVLIPANTRTVVHGQATQDTGEVCYKVEYRRHYYWVGPNQLTVE